MVLLAFSLLFYTCGGIDYLPILLASIAVNYLCGLLAAQERPRAIRCAGLWGAVVFGLGMLAWFKYTGFLVQNLNAMGVEIVMPQVVLPIGISFFTFQGLSYVIDVYRTGGLSAESLVCGALCVSVSPISGRSHCALLHGRTGNHRAAGISL